MFGSGNSDNMARRRRARLAAMAMMLSLGAAPSAGATVLFTETGTADGQVSLTETGNLGGFTFGFYHVQVSGGCGCMTLTPPGGGASTSSGTFSVVSAPFNFITNPQITNDPAANNQSAMPFGAAAPGVYFEQFGGFGNVALGTGVFTPGNILGGANNFEGFTIYATPGSNTATFEFDLDQFATSSLLTLPSGPLYLDVTGTTVNPVGLTDLTPGAHPDFLTFTAPLRVDFTVTLTDTRFSPIVTGGGGGGTGGVPEPATWGLLIAGFAGVGLALRRSRRLRTVLA